MEQKTSRVVKWSLIIGIVIVLNLFFNYSISVIYKAPQYDQFCKNPQIVEPITTQQQAYDYTCNQNYQNAQNTYDRNVFITLVALGVVVVALSFIFKANEVLSASFALGGVLSFIVASVRYWSSANDLIKMIILGIALVILIYMAYRKFSIRKPHEPKI